MNHSKTAAEFEAPRHLAATAGLPCRMSLNNPLVLQCRNCRRVLSDSNQLLCTIEALDGIVLDAVLGVRIGQEPLEAAGCKYVTLTCMTPDCGLEVGRCFTSAPPEISEAVQSDGKPRYVLHKAALQSYELGSTKQHHDAARGIAPEATQEGSREEALAHTANAAHTNAAQINITLALHADDPRDPRRLRLAEQRRRQVVQLGRHPWLQSEVRTDKP